MWRSAPGHLAGLATLLAFALSLTACAGGKQPPELDAAAAQEQLYRIGPGDLLRVFVWGNPGLTDTVPVRPDGRISIPLIEDLQVADKTPTEAARMIEERLAAFVEDPLVTVIVTEFVGPFDGTVRVVGEATEPKSIPYRAEMSLLDVMLEVGGLTEFAAGNRARLIRETGGERNEYRVRVGDLIRDGDISANVQMQPGDVLIIPESFF
ncbi:MAG TPA: XrtA/PEP-CTERM system exopolysaccharide export protein [Alphaproteobacteria bacterium]|nr:XrtA/PEP-CTERM system exopolysaccharide export protein [Alphaproteobacteria bacterium]